MDPLASQAVLVIYAILLAVGGVMGFVKAGSRPSLIAGLASALLAVGCAFLVGPHRPLGLWLGAALATVLLGFFGPRYVQGRKFMPGGLMALVSLLVLAFLVIQAARIGA